MTGTEGRDESAPPTSALERRTLLRRGVAGLILASGVSGLSTGAAADTTQDSTAAPAIPSTVAQTESTTQFSQQQKLTAGEAFDFLGTSVALSDDLSTAIIGSQNGLPTVFTKSDGKWSQQQQLTADDRDSGDLFGNSVALSSDGTTALIGAANDGDGSVYVFTRADGNWSQQQKLTTTDDDADQFGSSVSLSDQGDTGLITAPNGQPGRAYIFTRSGGEWSQQAKLIAETTEGDVGGSSALSADGNTALTEGSDGPFVFTRADGEWSQQQHLTPFDETRTFAGYPATLSDDGTTAITAAPGDSPNQVAYVFTRSEGEWSQQQKLSVDDEDTDSFADALALSPDGSTALIGFPESNTSSGDESGSTYVFTRSDGEWSQQQQLTADDSDSGDEFGSSVALSDDVTTALIGAQRDDTQNGEGAGSAYVFSAGESSEQLSVSLSPSSVPAGEQTDVTVDVTDTSGNGVSNATVSVSELGVSATTDSAGTATLSLTDPSSGEYTVSVTASGFSDVTTSLTVSSDDGSGNGPSVEATVKQAGTPGGRARVQYTVLDVSGQSSVALEFTTPSQVSVDTGASDTTGTFSSNAQQLLFLQPDGEITATVAFDIASDASADATFDIDTAALDENSTTTDSVTTTVGDVETGPVERFDADDDGEIELPEVQTAIRAFSNGELDLQGVQQVIGAFSS